MADIVLHVQCANNDGPEGPDGWPVTVREYKDGEEPDLPDGFTRMTPDDLVALKAALEPRLEDLRAAGTVAGKTKPRMPWHTVETAQAHVACVQAGLFNQITSIIEGLPEPKRTFARIAWEKSNQISIDAAFITELWPLLRLDGEPLSEDYKERLFQAAHAVRF